MNIIEYIDSYFQKTMNDEERKIFERKCEQDNAFAQEVAFFITARQSLREELLQQKQLAWQTKSTEDEIPFIPLLKKSFSSRWVIFAAAACFILAASVYLFETNLSPRTLANNYIKENYSNLSQLMSADKDSITLGKAAYNDKNYNRALQLFKGVEKNDAANSEAKLLTGLTYLQKDYYDSALEQFNALANMQGLFSNPGDFWKAVTLMKRNKPGDKDAAKKLLRKVTKEKEEGSDKADEWLKKI